MVEVELLYITLTKKVIQAQVRVPLGATVLDVLQVSGLLAEEPDLLVLPMGIFSKRVSLETLVASGDRVEIYRPLLIDPKEKRRLRAKTKR